MEETFKSILLFKIRQHRPRFIRTCIPKIN
nr:MAG TPA: hypothetical protein [Inoviridae sp.]